MASSSSLCDTMGFEIIVNFRLEINVCFVSVAFKFHNNLMQYFLKEVKFCSVVTYCQRWKPKRCPSLLEFTQYDQVSVEIVKYITVEIISVPNQFHVISLNRHMIINKYY